MIGKVSLSWLVMNWTNEMYTFAAQAPSMKPNPCIIMINISSSMAFARLVKQGIYSDCQTVVNAEPWISTQVETSFDPFRLLDTLKEIEKELGRQKSVRNGPRSIDLDILLYDDLVIDDERLSIPHKRIMEREFVLKPLCEYDL